MKKFLVNFVLFLLPLFILATLLDNYFSNQLRKRSGPAGEIEVWKDIFDNELECELAIYGSSRAWVQINSQIIEKSTGFKTYNFGIDGHNFLLQHLRHKKIMEYQMEPKIIVHSLDMFTLQKRIDLYNMDQFIPFMLWDSDFLEYTIKYEGYSYLDYFIPMMRYRHNISLLKNKHNNHKKERVKGFKGMERTWNQDLVEAQQLVPNYNVIIDSNSLNLYESFIEDCLAKNITLILVYSPEYIQGQNFVKNRSEVIELYRSLSKKFDVPFLDYSENYMCYDTSYFYNSLHLNAGGADIFSHILANDLKKILFKN